MGRFLSGVGRRRSPRTWALVALMACLSPGALTAQEGVARRALLVGVGDYQANDDRQNQIAASSVPPDLAGPANDVLLMARVLTTATSSACPITGRSTRCWRFRVNSCRPGTG